jgi:hypothetical protein
MDLWVHGCFFMLSLLWLSLVKGHSAVCVQSRLCHYEEAR